MARPKDEAAVLNERFWDEEVRKGGGYTVPSLDLDPDIVKRYAKGELDTARKPLTWMTPRSILADIDGQDVLCLACGGGQQSAVLSLLGAKVTVVENSQGQLNGDRKAAEHYGYDITTVHTDMRDLSMLDDESFDLVYGTAVNYVPDARQVYSEVARVLRRGGMYRSDWSQPVSHFIGWNGSGYEITKPYAEKVNRREDGAIEFRHYMDDIFNGLIETGFTIRQVEDFSRDIEPDEQAPRGSWTHESTYIGGQFVVVATKD